MTWVHRAPWLERLTGMQFVWVAGPVQLWLPGVPQYVVVRGGQ